MDFHERRGPPRPGGGVRGGAGRRDPDGQWAARRAAGTVLEVGIGSGLNLALYDPRRVGRLIGVDPDARLLALARRRAAGLAFAVELLEAPLWRLPLADASVDTVLASYAVCATDDPPAALAELRRVLRPGGALLLCEHGASPARLARCGPAGMAERRMPGGCAVRRDMARLVAASGFRAPPIMILPARRWPA